MKKKILLIFMCVLLLTGCTKSMQDDDGKIVRNEKTGQTITENIICKPTDKDIVNIYEENGRIDEAIKALETALTIHSNSNDWREDASLYNGLIEDRLSLFYYKC